MDALVPASSGFHRDAICLKMIMSLSVGLITLV